MIKFRSVLAILLLLIPQALAAPSDLSSPSAPHELLEIYGYVSDQHGNRIEEANVKMIADGLTLAEGTTLADGSYIITAETESAAKISRLVLTYYKFGHTVTEYEVNISELATRTHPEGLIVRSIRLDAVVNTSNKMSAGAWVALAIFLGSYVLILGGFVDRTVGAMLGGSLMFAAGLIFGFMDERVALAAVDFNVIGLLLGMMIIVAVLRPTGFFQAVAVGAARLARRSPWQLLVIISTATAVISMFVDNVTTMVLMVPITIVLAESLSIDPVPMLLAEVLLSNIGGVGTLIGDPPNVMIASAAGFTFNQFIVRLLPIVAITMVMCLALFRFFFASWCRTKGNFDAMARMDPRDVIDDPSGLRKSLLILAATVVLFSLQRELHISIAAVALLGGTASLLVGRQDIRHILGEVEWQVLLFFAGLFILVEGLAQVGILEMVAEGMVSMASGSALLATILVIWVSAIASAVVDNIPFVATMLPIVREIGEMGLNPNPVWWALAVGSGFGGNGTPVGSSAGVVSLVSADKAGHPVSMKLWLKVGIPITIFSCAVATVLMLLLFGFYSA